MTDELENTADPREPDILTEAFRAFLSTKHTALPGQVIKFTQATQTVSVQPIVRFARRDPETSQIIQYIPPIITNVPVMYPSATGFAITWPLTVGDQGLIQWCERSTDEWRSTGQADNTPRDIYRRFSYTDCEFYPGGKSPAEPLDPVAYDATKMVLQTNTEILIGDSSATDFVALASLVLTELQAIKTAYDLHVHSGVTVGAGSTAVPTVLLPAPSSPAATKVKAV